MAHQAQIEFFQACFETFPDFFLNGKSKIIDIGSMEINGGPHQLLKCVYLGVDIGPGPNVDLVCPAQEIGLPSHSFDAAISSECLEHNPFWRETLFQMARLTRPGGIVVWTCAGIGRPVHGTRESDNGFSAPHVARDSNYYQNIDAKHAKIAINHAGWFQQYAFFENFETHDTYFVGIRQGGDQRDLVAFRELKDYLLNLHGDSTSFKLRRLLFWLGLDFILQRWYSAKRRLAYYFHLEKKADKFKKKLFSK